MHILRLQGTGSTIKPYTATFILAFSAAKALLRWWITARGQVRAQGMPALVNLFKYFEEDE